MYNAQPMTNNPKYFLTYILSFLAFVCFSQKSSLFEILPDTGFTEVSLITDINQCIRKKFDETPQPAKLIFKSGPLQGNEYDLTIRTRGNMRKEICTIPPLKLIFSKSDFDYRKIKWVNVCSNSNSMEDHLIEEYLVYKIYQELTDRSFRTRLLKVDYYSQANLEKVIFTKYAILLEPEKELAARFEGRPYHPTVVRPDILCSQKYALMTVFQYLMGNTDWAVENQHNCTFISDRIENKVIPIPYDFDYTGFVNTYYATPNTFTPVKHVMQRYNRGHCIEDSVLLSTLELFSSKKEAILKIVRECVFLEEKIKNQKIKFLESGFEDFENIKRAKRIFCRDCKDF